MKNALDEHAAKARAGKDAQADPLRNPDGIYSGASKRVAMTDGSFAPVNNMPKNTRASLQKTTNTASGSKERS
ncbi:MAG: hypothetical protein NVS1B2_15800 [Vulcanimicrobiaceae bacterium]